MSRSRRILRARDANAKEDGDDGDSSAPVQKTEATRTEATADATADVDAADADDGVDDGLTAFERAREAHIARNKARMEALNINALRESVGAASRGSAPSSRGSRRTSSTSSSRIPS